MIRTLKAHTLAVLTLFCFDLCAQEYSFRTFGNAEGLSNLAVSQIFQDRIGFLWVSSENGVFRFDGDRFEAFGPAQGLPVTSAATFGDAPDGSLLVGGSFGLYRLRRNRFQQIPGVFHEVSLAQGIQADGRGHTFVGTDMGLLEMSSNSGTGEYDLRLFPQARGTSGPQVNGILLDGETLWYGCGHELCRMSSTGTSVFGRETGLPDRPVMTLLLDHEGNLWARTKGEGLFVRPAGQSRFQTPHAPVPDGLLIGNPSVDSEGRILVPSPNGLLIHDKQGWRMIDRAAGLRGVVYGSFEDRAHSLWIGLAGRGLAQWRGYGEWESYSTADGLVSDVVYETLPKADGTLWIGTEGGLMRGEPLGVGFRWSKVPGLEGFAVHSVREASNGDLWLGTETRGAGRLNPRTGAIEWLGEKQGIQGRQAYTLRFDSHQRLWVATDLGLFVSSPPYAAFSRISELPSSRIWAIAEGTDGSFWAGGEGGLFVLQSGHWQNFKPNNAADKTPGLSNQEVLSLGAGPKGVMWVGYRFGGGIDRVHLERDRLIVGKGVQRPGTDGLVYFLQFDSTGRLWAGTEHGIDVWDGAHWDHYDSSDGLAWDDCNLNSFTLQTDGTVWIGTSGGLSRFKPKPRSVLAQPLNVVFTRLMMGSTDVTGQSIPASGIRANSLVARFSALNATRENSVQFRYRLQGADSTWTETAQRELQFAQLAPGSYVLQVEAQNGDGIWSEHRADFAFRILAPWYRSWWVLALGALIPFGIVAALARIRIRRAETRERELRRLVDAQEEIRNLAFFDPLTGLANRRLLTDLLSKVLASSARSGRLRALLFVDLDKFKLLNDSLGHQTGDLLLLEVAHRLSTSIREADTVARLGGDEFVILAEDLGDNPETAAAHAGTMAEKIRAILAETYILNDRECRSAASIGITIFGDQPLRPNEVLQQADMAMYEAKTAGRNTVRFFAPALQAAVNARVALEEEFRLALSSGQFLLHYQPQVKGRSYVGVEALVRWNHPARGLLSPAEFIPLAEETDHILPLGDWVLETACRQIAALARNGNGNPLTVSINISVRQLRQPDFSKNVLATVQHSGVNPRSIILEVTESMLVEGIDDVVAKMEELKSHGLRFSLDDFGTGYASLSYLKRLPLDQMKIDRTFIRDILVDSSGAAVVQAIIALGRAMGLTVMAEGVETVEQRDFLADLGCEGFQGYFISPPIPIEQLQVLLNSSAAASTLL